MSELGELVDAIADDWPDTSEGWYHHANRYDAIRLVLQALRSLPVEQRAEAVGLVEGELVVDASERFFYGVEVNGEEIWPTPYTVWIEAPQAREEGAEP